MTSVIVLFRNAPQLAQRCLESLRACDQILGANGPAEYVLIDDCSDADRAVMPALLGFREQVRPASVRVLRFRRPMHYTHGLAYGLSAASGDEVLFVSHDMMLTPACVTAMREVARADASIGIIRPTSPHMDWARKFVQIPPTPPASIEDVSRFAEVVYAQFGTESVNWPMLIGDAMLVRRSVIDRIGVFDTRYFGFMGDIDFGVRLHRAGFKHVIARGAWLNHEGAGTAKETASAGGQDMPAQGRQMLALVESAYALFRAKWGEENLPAYFRDMKREHFDRLNTMPPKNVDTVQPTLPLTTEVVELL